MPHCCASVPSACVAAASSQVSGLLCRAVSRSPPGGDGVSLAHSQARCAGQQNWVADVRIGSQPAVKLNQQVLSIPNSRHWPVRCREAGEAMGHLRRSRADRKWPRPLTGPGPVRAGHDTALRPNPFNQYMPWCATPAPLPFVELALSHSHASNSGPSSVNPWRSRPLLGDEQLPVMSACPLAALPNARLPPATHLIAQWEPAATAQQ